MPIREHITEQSYIDWLKSLGCLVYMTLSADGDFKDRISGLSLQMTGNGSMSWNTTYQMYQVNQPSSTLFAYVASLDNGLDASWFPDDNFTVLQTIRKITSSSAKFMNTISPKSGNGDTCASTAATWSGTGRTNAFPAAVCDCGYVGNHSNTTRYYYQNGALITTAAEATAYLPSNWVMTGTGITIGCNRVSNCYSTQYCISNIYMFNTALDLATIRKIQGYE